MRVIKFFLIILGAIPFFLLFCGLIIYIFHPNCDRYIPQEIQSLIYPGANHICWQKRYNRLMYDIGLFDQTSSSKGYEPGKPEGSSEGIRVYIHFQSPPSDNLPALYGYRPVDKINEALNIPGYKVTHIVKGESQSFRYNIYALSSSNTYIEVATSEWGLPLKVDPLVIIKYVTDGLKKGVK